MSRLTSVHPKPTASPLLPVVLLLLCTLSLLATPGQSAATSFTVTPSAGANGTISPNTPQSVTSGANLTFTAAANAGYTVDCWALDSAVVQIGNARYLLKNITAGHTVKVTFKSLPTVTVTPVAGTNGAIAPHTPQAVLPGASLAFTATANAGYTVDTWFLDYAYAQSGGAQYTLANITASHTVSVNFKALGPYVITPNAGANGTINPYSARIMPYGSSLTFTATAVAGYTADCWYLDGTSIQTGGALYTLNNITANHAVKVTFKLIPVPGGRGEWWLFRHDLLHTGRSPYVGPTGTRQKWVTPYTASAGFYVVSSPSLGVDGTLYVGSQASNKLYAIRPDGTVKWTFSTQGVVISTPAIDTDGTIYFGANDNNFYAVRPDGTAKWAHPFVTGGNIQCSPAIGVDGTVYVGSYDGNLYAINPDGSRKWAYYVSNQVFSSPAIAADGTLYVGSQDGKLYALGSTAPATLTITPSAGANGTITPNTPQMVNTGASLTLSAAANAGYTVDSWALDSAVAQTGGVKYTLSNITASHTVKVTFKTLLSYTVTPSAGANGTITPNIPQTVLYGGNVTFIATANAGYTTDSWSLDGIVAQPGGAQYALSNVTANHVINVTFKPCLPYQPDLAIRTSSETSYTGFGIYNLTGANQTKSLTVATSVTAVYLFAVKNAGSLADTFTLHCSSVDPTWRVQCINRDSGGDVTASFVGTQGATVSLTLGSVANYTLDLTPYANAKTMTVTISATSAADGTKQDVIKTVSTKQ